MRLPPRRCRTPISSRSWSGVITQLLNRDIEITVAAADALAQLLVRRLPAAAANLAVSLIDRLLSHADAGKQMLGARLLVANRMGFTEIPERLLQHINGSVHEEVRAVAIALLNKQTPDDLLQQSEMLAELLYRGSAVERRELLALFAKLAGGSPENAGRVLRALSPLLFRADHEPGQGDELCAFFLAHLQASGTGVRQGHRLAPAAGAGHRGATRRRGVAADSSCH